MFGIAVSRVIGVPSEIVYDGILSVQIISHMPLNSVNFPNNVLKFMQLLNYVVSFNLLDPSTFKMTPWSFTKTPPYNDNFEWLQYDTSNFYENIGFITVIVLLMMLRQFIVSPFLHWFT